MEKRTILMAFIMAITLHLLPFVWQKEIEIASTSKVYITMGAKKVASSMKKGTGRGVSVKGEETANIVGGGDVGVGKEEIGQEIQIEVEYPKISRRLGEEGRVTLSFSVSDDGEIKDVKVIHSSGFSRLDEAAIQALSKHIFSGPVNPTEVTIHFKLN